MNLKQRSGHYIYWIGKVTNAIDGLRFYGVLKQVLHFNDVTCFSREYWRGANIWQCRLSECGTSDSQLNRKATHVTTATSHHMADKKTILGTVLSTETFSTRCQ